MSNSNISHLFIDKSKVTSAILPVAKRYVAGESEFWLKSPYQSDVWKVVDGVKARKISQGETVICEIDFSYPQFSDGTSLLSPGNEEWDQLVRACVCFNRSGLGSYSTSSAERLLRLKNSLIYCIDYLRRQGRFSLKDVEPSLLQDFIINFLPYGPAYFLDWRERFLIALKRERHLLIEGARLPNLASILNQANISLAFEGDAFYRAVREHIQETYAKRKERHGELETVNFDLPGVVPETTMTSHGMRNYFVALHTMYEVGPFLKETGIPALAQNPIEGIHIDSLSNVSEGRTRTIPPTLAIQFVGKSIEYIERYSSSLLACYNNMAKKLASTADEESSVLHKEMLQRYINRRKNDPSFDFPDGIESVAFGQKSLYREIFTNLVSACAVVLLAFSARRESEVYDLRTDCRQYKDLLKIYIAKTDKSYQFIPKVEVVDRALDILMVLSQRNRQLTKSTKLFEFSQLSSSATINWAQSAAKRINEFAEEVGCHVDSDGSIWRYSEHQFRRFFAMMYFWHSSSKNIDALSYHLRHFSIDMTHRYIDEAIAGDVVTDVAKLKTRYLMAKSLNNKTPMGREFAKRKHAYEKFISSKLNILNIKQASKRLQREYQDELTQLIENSIDHMTMYPEIKPWGACFGRTKGRNKRAKCVPTSEKKQRNVFRTRAAAASCEDCLNCSNFYADKDNLPFYDIQISEDQALLAELERQGSRSSSLAAFVKRRMGKLIAVKEAINET